MILLLAALIACAAPPGGNVEALRSIVHREPGNVRARHALAGALIEAERYTEAEAELRAVIERSPEYQPATFDLGKLLADTGRAAEALLTFDRAAALAPSDPAPVVEAASVLVGLGRAGDARLRLEKARSAGPPVLALLAFTALRQGDHVAAREAATACLDEEAALWPVRVLRAIAATVAGDLESADADLTLAESVAPPGQANTRFTRALLDFARGAPAAALDGIASARAAAPGMFDPDGADFDPLAFATSDELRFLAWANQHGGTVFPRDVALQLVLRERDPCTRIEWLTWLLSGPEALAPGPSRRASVAKGRVTVAGVSAEYARALKRALPSGSKTCRATWKVIGPPGAVHP